MKVKVTVRVSTEVLGSTVKVTSSPSAPLTAEGTHQSCRPPRRHSPLLVTVTAVADPSSIRPSASKVSLSAESSSVASGTGASAPLSSPHPVQAAAANNIQTIFFIILSSVF